MVTDPDHAPIFVVGSGRSGTTLLRMMLCAHPRIHLTHEASFYLSLAGLPGHPDAATWLARYLKTVSFAWLGIEKESLCRDMPDDLGHKSCAEAFLVVMRHQARRFGKDRYGDKTPLHSLHLDTIFRDHPGARVVHVVRDPRGTVASLCRMPWAPASVGLNSFYCDKQMKAVRPYRDRILEVRLEDLLRDPASSLRDVLAFIGEPWDDAVLDHEHHAPGDDLPPFPWFSGARRNVRKPDGDPAWMRLLGPAWIRVVEQMNRYGMECYGYEPAVLDPEPAYSERLKVRLADVPRAARASRRLIRFARMSRRKELPDPQTGMEALLNINPDAWRHYPGFVMPRVPGT